jgi:subtilisin family serine protease
MFAHALRQYDSGILCIMNQPESLCLTERSRICYKTATRVVPLRLSLLVRLCRFRPVLPLKLFLFVDGRHTVFMPDSPQIIALPLKQRIDRDPSALHRVVIDLDISTRKLGEAYARVVDLVGEALKAAADRTEQHIVARGDDARPYVKARFQGSVIQALVRLDQQGPDPPVISAIRRDLDDGRVFNPDNLVRSVISVPMLDQIEADEDALQSVLIEVNMNYPGGRSRAKSRIMKLATDAIAQTGGATTKQFISSWKSGASNQYVYVTLSGKAIRYLVEQDQKTDSDPDKTASTSEVDAAQKPDADNENNDWRAIYHVWPDFKLRAQIWRSVSTVKADASRRAFATTGRGIVWAVLDSGIDGKHPHFVKHSNLNLPNGLNHMDFIGPKPVPVTSENLADPYGHGTHVAGIIAGELDSMYQAVSLSRERDQNGKISYVARPVAQPVMGVAPECTLLSYRVLDENGEGDVSTVIAAIQMIQELNGYGRQILIHGVNMSLGYNFLPEWFACGQSPVCVEVDRLVRSGVAVVIAAGNTGNGFMLTINDPGNAELAITVGATHRDMPHRYGVSYFSSKGPTGDGRLKPDVLAPGERIVSCGAGPDLDTYKKNAGPLPVDTGKNSAFYLERSGTSMAAPHVSGILVGILSTRTEFVGLPEEMKDYLIKNATDLGRDRNFQGGGLVDMMRTIQAM